MDKMDIDLPLNNKLQTMNNIYQFQFMPFDLNDIYNEILGDATIDEVDDAFSQFIVQNIEPVGWNAILMPATNDSHYIVEVMDVNNKLKATVIILEKVSKTNDHKLSDEDNSINYTINKEYLVPLEELYVISDNDNEKMFKKTALNIEVVRFFYHNLLRPWDDLNESRDVFFSSCVVPRLKLIFDIKHKLLSEKLLNRYEEILTKGNEIKKQMIKINKDNIVTDPVDPSDDCVNELNLLDYIRLKLKLEELQYEMKFIEDSTLRTLYDTIITVREDETDLTIHLVAEKPFNLISLSDAMLKLNPILINELSKWPIKLHNSFSKALKSAKSGDKIFLTTGTYSHSLSWIQNDIEICGLEPGVTIISNKECGDVFMFINVPNSIKLSNLTIKAAHPMENLLLIKCGNLILNECILDCNNMITGKPIYQVNKFPLTHFNTKIIGTNWPTI